LGSPETTELYAGVSYGPATLKYSYAVSQLFGVPDSEGSDYLELSVNQPVMESLTLNALLGHQRYKGPSRIPGNVGQRQLRLHGLEARRDLRFRQGVHGRAYYKGTDADATYFTIKGKDWSRDRFVAFAAYSF